jgi:hypothetical protein
MDKELLKSNILNGETSEQFVSLLIWGLIGFLFSILIELGRHKDKIQKLGGFSLGYWLKDNIIRFILSILTIIIGSLFSNELIGKNMNNWSAFLTGLVTDKIIEALSKYKSIIIIKNGTKSTS